MKLYLRDTSIVNYFVKGVHPGLHVCMMLAKQAQDIVISAITRATVALNREWPGLYWNIGQPQ